MARHSIELTPEEEELKSKIHFDIGPILRDQTAVIQNGKHAAMLVESLARRKAIPAIRVKYWSDPSFQHGRMKGSHQHIFERNGTTGRAIFEHPHFLPILKYMIDGANLPPSVIEAFCQQAERWANVSGSDAIELGKLARDAVRKHRLNKSEASEEFYRLALDCGIAEMWANTIREQVSKMPIRKH